MDVQRSIFDALKCCVAEKSCGLDKFKGCREILPQDYGCGDRKKYCAEKILKKYLSGSGRLVSFIKKFCPLDTINYFTMSVKSSLTLLRRRDYGLWMSKGQYLMP